MRKNNYLLPDYQAMQYFIWNDQRHAWDGYF